MRTVLEMHDEFPQIKTRIKLKQPNQTDVEVPERYSSLTRFKSDLDYRGQVAKSCIHCHQVRDAQRVEYRDRNQPLPEKLLYPFPSGERLGLTFNKKTRATVNQVVKGSAAAKAGMKSRDQIDSINGCQIASEADIHWILHNLEGKAQSLDVVYTRGGNSKTAKLQLAEGWRKETVIDWRPTSWDLRRMATGGMTLKTLSDRERTRLKIVDGKMALRADHVGRYGNHARAMRAGIRKGDVIVSFGGRDDLMSESALIEFAVQEKKRGDTVSIIYLRNGQKKEASIRLQ